MVIGGPFSYHNRQQIKDRMEKTDQIGIFNRRAQKLKSVDVDFANRKIFALGYRRRLLKNASGRLLEVAVGTGSNFRFYQPFVEVTAVDFSGVLIDIAKKNAARCNIKADFIQSDVEMLDFREDSFDTIVSTLSLCSYDDPLKVLHNFNRWCRPEGEILLLEHGLSSNRFLRGFINPVLNMLNPLCMKYMGDNINADIMKTVKLSGLRIEEIRIFLFGTHYMIKAKPD
jgi:ubiquinone/menaquinone biosynthesis C-methylase UbiE